MSGTHGLLQPNQPGYYYITLEEGYVTLFKINANKWFEEHKNEANAEKKRDARSAHAVAKAYITDVLENLSKELYKETESEQNLWVFLSFPQLEIRLHGGVKMRTLKDAMKEMIEDGYIFKRPNRDHRYKSLEYRLNLPKYRKELVELPTKDVRANLHEGIDSANLHDVSANLHDDDAKMHDASANLHARKNIDITKNKQRESKNGTNESTQSDSLIPPSTPSLSQVEHLSTIAVDKQANGVDDIQLPIATATTRNASNQRNTEPLTLPPDSEATRVFNLLCEVFYAIPPDVITEHISKQCASLAPHVRNVEDMKSLKDYTRAQILEDPRYKKKRVYLGNLVDHLDGWKQEREPLPEKPTTSSKPSSVSGMRNYTFEPEPQRAIQEPTSGELVAVPGFSLKALREQKKKERTNV